MEQGWHRKLISLEFGRDLGDKPSNRKTGEWNT
jgi:hypothetical protein